MRIHYTGESFVENGFFKLKNQDWLKKQRVAGKAVAGTLNLLKSMVEQESTLSCLEMNELAESYIAGCGCQATFKGYKGFPAGVCMSVNKELVHGIPKDYKLQQGDVISFDLGATYQGAIADSALTCIFGKPKSDEHVRLLKATEESLMNGIAAIKLGDRLGVIGNAISNTAKKYKFASVIQYGGHGISWDEPHTSPFVSNKSNIDEGIRIQKGLTIAIEPMFVEGNSNKTYVDKDGWTVWGMGISAHFEHTIFIHEDHVEIITDRG